MAITGMIPWSAAVFIVLGQNVGTCFTTMLTSIGANKNTRAASFVHFVYNAAGAIIFSILAFIFFTFVNPAFGATAALSTHVSMIHTGYNVLLLLLLFPLGNVILRIAVKMAGEEKPSGKCDLTELDESILDTPKYALENSVRAVGKLTELINAKKMLAQDVDRAGETIRCFLTRLYNRDLSEEEKESVTKLLDTLTDLDKATQPDAQRPAGSPQQPGLQDYAGCRPS
jgi:phosphate:Na+ symporter